MPFGFGKGGRRKRVAGRCSGGHGRGRQFMDQTSGYCICPACGTTIAHHRGLPCFQTVCPSCGSGMTRKLGMPVNSSEQNTISLKIEKPKVNADLCTGCSRCVKVCPVNAITIINRKAVIDESRCNNCHACVLNCPESAIK